MTDPTDAGEYVAPQDWNALIDRPETILIDTRKNVILGRGSFSFRDETIDLRVRADGKKFSLFSAQSPVGIGGHFSSPSLDVITPELLARAGEGDSDERAGGRVRRVLAADGGGSRSLSPAFPLRVHDVRLPHGDPRVVLHRAGRRERRHQGGGEREACAQQM